MPKLKTVLILGAGASHPYGFPLGHKLLLDIYNTTDQYQSNASILKDDQQDFIRQWKGLCQIDDRAIVEFARLLRTSGHSSIDAFLAQAGARNARLIDIGKAAIALQLVPYEDEDRLFHHVHNDGDDWYRHLWSSISDLATLDDLAIITLNYDRSLEHFLYTSIRSSLSCTHDEASTTLKRLRIIHPHGQLGAHPYIGTSDSRAYGSGEKLEAAIKNIKIVSQAESTTEEFSKAREVIKGAQVICILGFAFNRQTLDRLEIHKNSNSNLIIFASSFQLGAGFVDELKSLMPVKGKNCQFIPRKVNWVLSQSNALSEPIKRELLL